MRNRSMVLASAAERSFTGPKIDVASLRIDPNKPAIPSQNHFMRRPPGPNQRKPSTEKEILNSTISQNKKDMGGRRGSKPLELSEVLLPETDNQNPLPATKSNGLAQSLEQVPRLPSKDPSGNDANRKRLLQTHLERNTIDSRTLSLMKKSGPRKSAVGELQFQEPQTKRQHVDNDTRTDFTLWNIDKEIEVVCSDYGIEVDASPSSQPSGQNEVFLGAEKKESDEIDGSNPYVLLDRTDYTVEEVGVRPNFELIARMASLPQEMSLFWGLLEMRCCLQPLKLLASSKSMLLGQISTMNT